MKKEKPDKKKKEKLHEDNLMSVLELLELQARARAIKSQLIIEASKRSQEQPGEIIKENDSDNDDVIIESPKNDEIVITSSDSENEDNAGGKDENIKETVHNLTETATQSKKIILIRDRIIQKATVQNDSQGNGSTEENIVTEKNNTIETNTEIASTEELTKDSKTHENALKVPLKKGKEEKKQTSTPTENENIEKNTTPNAPESDDDDIVLIVDHEEIEGLTED